MTRRAAPRPVRTLAVLAALALAAAAARPLWALEGEIDVDAVPSAALVPGGGAGPAPAQAESTRITAQAAGSGQASLSDELTLSATAWGLLDSLPGYNPLVVPANHLALSSRLLQADVSWQLMPGTLTWSAGKEVIHPSSGFFRTPLNLLSRGPAGNVAQQVPAAAPQWEEGWIGTRLLWVAGDLSMEDFFSPRLAWTSAADTVLGYVTAQQAAWVDQLRVQAHVLGVDVQALALVSTEGPGSADPAVHVQLGAGVDANLGDRLTVRAEAAVSDVRSRLVVVDPVALTVSTQSVPWAVQALAGVTWSISTKTSLLVEYAYNGLGFSGSAYSAALTFQRNRASAGGAGATAPDVLGQFGSFSAAQHYAFARLATDITDQLTAQGWTEVNLQDPSALLGVGLNELAEGWGLGGSVTASWGGPATEAGSSPFLWQLDIELKLFF